MKVHQGIETLPKFKNPVVTIGSFDGVHHGHRKILEHLIIKANEHNGESVLVTFDPHPRQVVSPSDKELKLLNTLEEKLSLLEETGLDHVIVLPFTIEFSQITPTEYIQSILIDAIGTKYLIIGFDHKFGSNRSGDIRFLKEYADSHFEIEEIPEQAIEDLKVSSTEIRKKLLSGNIKEANEILGQPYVVSGIVVKGSQIAGKLGYPTANCKVSNKIKLIPLSGTYAASAICDRHHYNGMLYIGKSPTLQNRDQDKIEMHLFSDTTVDLYDKKINIRILKRIRDDQKFSDKKELLFNIEKDKQEALDYFGQLQTDTQLTIAILNYNGKHHLEQYLPSYQLEIGHDIVVIDNQSNDDSIEFLRREYPHVKIIETPKNLGFAAGYNYGLEQIFSPYIAIVNSDVQVTDSWTSALIRRLEKDKTIIAVQPKILSIKNKNRFEYAGGSGGFIDHFGYPLCRGRVIQTVETDRSQYDDRVETFWSSGAAMIVRTDLFKRLGGFDPMFFAHMEEIDFCWRAKTMGYKIVVQPKSEIYHLGGGTLDYKSTQKLFLNIRNNYWMLLKNEKIGYLLWILPIRVLIDFLYGLQFLVRFQPLKFLSVIKGQFKALLSLSKISTDRKILRFLKNRYQVAPPNTTGKISVLLPFCYFILRKRTFDQYE